MSNHDSQDALPPETLLSMEGVTKSFGATQALQGVSLEVRAGEVMALIGENGAGKSTLMKVLSGAITADQGKMRIAGADFSPSGPQDALDRGVAMIYQELNLAVDLSVEDNIMLGREDRRFGLLNRNAQRKKVVEALGVLGHNDISPTTPVEKLSIGEQQLVEIARAIAFDAKVIIFDEPTSSLTQADAQRLFNVIHKLKMQGIGIVYISHFLEEIQNNCDRYTVLRDGQQVGTGDLVNVSNEQIVSLMVGRDVDDLFPRIPHERLEKILSVTNLTGDGKPEDVTLDLYRGEILGVAGLVGAGRTELVRAIFGLDVVRSGSISVAGSSPKPEPTGRIKAGLGFVSEDRKNEGLAQDRSIADNLTLSRLTPYSRLGFLNLAKRKRAVEKQMHRMHVKAQGGFQEVSALSGGNQQKVAIARVLHQEAEVLLLDEPTRGIDVGTKSEIYRLMGELAAQGKAIIFVSSYLPELMAVCDRVAVMARGRLQEVKEVQNWTEEEVMAVAVRSNETE